VPADGFFEWKTPADDKRAAKQPYLIRRVDRGLFAFAGLWETWRVPGQDQVIQSCAIVTATANRTLAALHHRMPVILAPEDHAAWLAAEGGKALLRPCPEDWLDWAPVSTRVNKPANDDASCIEPLEIPAATRQASLF
jgi:putative SOS response-associated peptidase YedK